MMCCVAQDNAQQLVLLAGDARPITCVMNHYQHCKSASSRQRMSRLEDTAERVFEPPDIEVVHRLP